MENVTDRTSNPFGLRPPCGSAVDDRRPAVFGYGDANADFHVIGDHPGVHGGVESGVPFTGTESGRAVQELLRAVGFASGPRERPVLENCFCSYLHACTRPGGRRPTESEYAALEPSFDAELRAINAHVLLPVGERATEHVLREYTTRWRLAELDPADLHAREIRGRGFMVIPILEPTAWIDGDREVIVRTVESVLASDYRQTKGVATTVG